MKLTDKQRRYLRGQGHALKPIILIGKDGLTDGVIAETARALKDHELIKVRISGMEREARDEALALLAEKTGSDMPGRIGHTALLYRPNKEKPKLVLPKA